MTVSTHRVVSEAHASGTAQHAEPSIPPWLLPAPDGDLLGRLARSSAFDRQALARAARDDFPDWLDHVKAAARCSRPVRLSGTIYHATKTGDSATITAVTSTASMPDGVIYKACGNRRASVCPACSKVYQRDAYQIILAGLVGGKGIPEQVVEHPGVFATLTAPSFGFVHTRYIRRHTCADRRRCDCRPEPCHARRGMPRCRHGRPEACFARHEDNERSLGRPLCLDCYDHEHQVVWNRYAGELWRRTKQAIDRHLAKLARQRGIPRVQVGVNPATGKPRTVPPVRVSCGKAAEFQARGVVHFHALIRLDGVDPDDPTAIVAPPDAFDDEDLKDAVRRAAEQIRFTTPWHPDRPEGWLVHWGPFDKGGDVRTVALSGGEHINAHQVAGYLAKYATKSTEAAGLHANRFYDNTIHAFANFGGNHIERLLAACWKLGRRTTPRRANFYRPDDPRLTTLRACPSCGSKTTMVRCETCHPHPDDAPATPVPAERDVPSPDDPDYFTGLQRRAHMLGYGGHFYTHSRRYSVTFTHERQRRIAHCRKQTQPQPTNPDGADLAAEETKLVISTLAIAGFGWRTPADAILANTSAAMAREHQQLARHLIAAIDL